MTREQYLKNLTVPQGPVDVVLDTDTYNEIDDQFALSYLIRSGEKLHTKAVYAAPFFNENSKSPGDGMERSYQEILKLFALLNLTEEDIPVFRGSQNYLADEKTPQPSPAADDLVRRAASYSPEHPLYVVAIGAITNVASALLLDPSIAEKIVLVWLGGNAWHHHTEREFNMGQDIAAARIVMSCGAPFVQLPCIGVVDSFTVSKPELEYWFCDKNPLADYLARNTIAAADAYAAGKAWTRVIWDVTAVAWLLNDEDRFLCSRLVNTRLPNYDHSYGEQDPTLLSRYVYKVRRDALLNDLIEKLTK